MVKLSSWVHPKDASLRMRPFVLHKGLYGDVLRTSRYFSGSSSGSLWDVNLPSGWADFNWWHSCTLFSWWNFDEWKSSLYLPNIFIFFSPITPIISIWVFVNGRLEIMICGSRYQQYIACEYYYFNVVLWCY